jgi:hypothetical protein
MTPEQINKLLVEVPMVELNEYPKLRQVKPVNIVMETKLSGHDLRSIANDPRPEGHRKHFKDLL